MIKPEVRKSWRVGTKIPINVYEGNTPICQCHTAEKAAQIVAALNADLRLAELIAAAEGMAEYSWMAISTPQEANAMIRLRAALAAFREVQRG